MFPTYGAEDKEQRTFEMYKDRYIQFRFYNKSDKSIDVPNSFVMGQNLFFLIYKLDESGKYVFYEKTPLLQDNYEFSFMELKPNWYWYSNFNIIKNFRYLPAGNYKIYPYVQNEYYIGTGSQNFDAKRWYGCVTTKPIILSVKPDNFFYNVEYLNNRDAPSNATSMGILISILSNLNKR
jgi:hypothetical protein